MGTRGVVRFGPYLDLLPFAAVVALIFIFSTQVPRADDWDLVPIVQKVKTGTLTWNDLNAPYAGHKFIVSYPIMAAVAIATHWNRVGMELVSVAIAFVAWLALRPEAVKAGTLLASSIVFWSFNQWITWLWPWVMSGFLALAFSLWAIRWIRERPQKFLAALIFAIAGSLCYGGGLAVWPALIYLVRRDRSRLMGTLVAMMSALLFFLLPYHRMSGVGFSWTKCLPFFLNAIGAPVAPATAGAAILAGAVVLYLVFRIVRAGDDFAAAVSFFGLVSMLLVTLSRSGGHAWDYGGESRYGTDAAMVWAPLLFTKPPLRRWVLYVIVAGCLFKGVLKIPWMIRYEQATERGKAALFDPSGDHYLLIGGQTSREQFDQDVELMKKWGYLRR